MKIAMYGMSPWEIEQLEKMVFEEKPEFIFVDDILKDETVSFTAGCDAVSLMSNSLVDDNMAKKLSENGVKYITSRSTGIDHLHKDAIRKYGLDAANVPSYSPGSISEHTMLLLLSLLRKMKKNQEMINQNNYKINGIRGKELAKMTVGVFGSGKIGEITIKMLAGFGCRILVHDVFEKESVKQYASYVSKEEIQKQADVIILHCPLLPDTYHLVDEKFIAGCKDGVILVNTARGGLVDAKAVLDALEAEKISEFAFDVYEGEDAIVRYDFEGAYPPDELFEKLCRRDDVIYTAHVSFFTDEAAFELVRISTENAVEFCMKGACKNTIL